MIKGYLVFIISCHFSYGIISHFYECFTNAVDEMKYHVHKTISWKLQIKISNALYDFYWHFNKIKMIDTWYLDFDKILKLYIWLNYIINTIWISMWRRACIGIQFILCMILSKVICQSHSCCNLASIPLLIRVCITFFQGIYYLIAEKKSDLQNER